MSIHLTVFFPTAWFITCEVMVVGCLIVEVAVVLLVASVFLHFCPILNHEYYQTYGMFAAASMMFLVSKYQQGDMPWWPLLELLQG